MAKAKKSTSESGSSGKKKEAEKKAPEAKKVAPPSDLPKIDTSAAAAAAAKSLAHKDDIAASAAGAGGESQSFKQLKESLHKPGGQTTPAFLNPVAPAKKFNQEKFGHQQIGRNQTFGADVNRSGVPRRTGG